MCCHLVDCGFAFQVVMFDHVVWEVRNLEPHVFIPFHGGIEVDILDVDHHVVGVLGGNVAVLMQLDSEQGDGGRAEISRIDDALPPNCQACPVWVVLCWFVAHHNASIRDIPPAVVWGDYLVYEENCIGDFDLSRHALREAPEFVAI